MSDKLEFLRDTTPFNKLPLEELQKLAPLLREIHFGKKEQLYQQSKTPIEGLDIIYEGAYEVFTLTSDNVKKANQRVETGQTYGAFSILLNKGKSLLTVEVEKKTVIYRMPADTFKNLCKSYDDFYQYFLTAFGKEMLNGQYIGSVSNAPMDLETLSFDRYFVRKLHTVNVRQIISCDTNTPCHDAARLMEQHKLSCLFVENQGVL